MVELTVKFLKPCAGADADPTAYCYELGGWLGVMAIVSVENKQLNSTFKINWIEFEKVRVDVVIVPVIVMV